MLPEHRLVHVVDDDLELAQSIARLLERKGIPARAYADPEIFLAHSTLTGAACLLIDVMLGPRRGFEIAATAREMQRALGVVFMTAWPKTADAVDAIRRFAGFDYLEKPLNEERLLAAVTEGLVWSANQGGLLLKIATLTVRERQVLGLIAQGKSNKMIAQELGLSTKTIEDHRAAIRTKTATTTLPELMTLAAGL